MRRLVLFVCTLLVVMRIMPGNPALLILLAEVVVLVSDLSVDLLYAMLAPRIRYRQPFFPSLARS